MTGSFKFACPHCQQPLETGEQPREEILCPNCQSSIFPDQVKEGVPPPPPPPPPPPLPPSPPPKKQHASLIITTGAEVSGREIEEYLGVVRGIVVRSPTATQSLFGGLKQVVGGNIEAYAGLCEQARLDAFARMFDSAKQLEADAVIAFRYDATEFAPGITEVLAYGTAVKLRPVP